jgi:hypothetical protein
LYRMVKLDFIRLAAESLFLVPDVFVLFPSERCLLALLAASILAVCGRGALVRS